MPTLLISAFVTVVLAGCCYGAAPSFVASFATLDVNENFGVVPPSATPEFSQTYATSLTSDPGLNVSFVVTNDNGGLFASPPTVDAAGVLTFTVANFENGVSQITVVPFDGNTSGASQFVSVTVLSVNNAPECTLLQDKLTLARDAAPTTFATFFSDVRAGPAMATDETSQNVSLSVSSVPSGAVIMSVTLSGSLGELTIAPAAAFFGNVTVFASLLDDGGQLRGGDDTNVMNFSVEVPFTNYPPTFVLAKGVLEVSPWHTEASAAVGGGTLYTFTNFISTVSPGLNEGFQSTSESVSTDHPEHFTIQPSLDGFGALTFTCPIGQVASAALHFDVSDDAIPNATTRQTISLTIGVNANPSFVVAMQNVVVQENAGSIVFANWASSRSVGPLSENNQTLTSFVLTLLQANQSALFVSNPSVDLASGNLTFQTAQHQNVLGHGVVYFELQLFDDAGGVSCSTNMTCQLYSITVESVNDVPAFAPGSDIVIYEDSGDIGTGASLSRTFPAWAQGMSVGSATEIGTEGQSWVFSTATNATALFAVQPSVAHNGSLTFSLLPNANGVALIDVTLSDTGSPPVTGSTSTLTLTVEAVNDVPTVVRHTATPSVLVMDEAPVVNNTPHVVHMYTFVVATGPADALDEVTQTLTTSVTWSPLSMFQPLSNSTIKDGILELWLVPVALAYGSGTITITVVDSGGVARGGVDETDITVPFTLVAINQNPTFAPKVTEIQVLQPKVLDPTFIPQFALSIFDPDSTALSFSTTNTNNALFADQPVVDITGGLRFTVAPEQCGDATVYVTLSDDGVPAPVMTHVESFAIKVTHVNRCPTFLNSGIVAVDRSVVSTPVTISGYIKNVQLGPACDATQTLEFFTNNNNALMFDVAPLVSMGSNASIADLRFTLKPMVSGVVTVTIFAKDNGGTSDGGCDTSVSHTMLINVRATNIPPSFACGTRSLTEPENKGAVSYSNWASAMSAGAPSESGQTLWFELSFVNASHAALFKQAPIVASASGDLSFELNADMNTYATGPVLINVELFDNGNTTKTSSCATASCCQLSIVVTPVNHAPSFTAGLDVTVFEDLVDITPPPANLTYTQAGWARNVYVGSLSEEQDQHQTVAFIVSVSNAAIFATLPSISPDGTLAFTLMPSAWGTSTLTVALLDSGASPNMSPVHSVTVTVLSVNDAPSFRFSRSAFVVAENSGTTKFPAALASLSVGPADEAAQTLRYTVAVINGSHLLVATPVIDDSDPASPALSVSTSINVFGDAYIRVTAIDSGGSLRGDDQTAHDVLVTVTAVNQVPFFTIASTSLTLPATSTIVRHSFVTGVSPGAGDIGQNATTTATPRNPALFSTLALFANGTLLVVPMPGMSGTSVVDVVTRDNGAPPLSSATQTFSVTVVAVNRAPTITVPAALNVTRCDISSQCVVDALGFGTGISAGSAQETSQTLSVTTVAPVSSYGFFDQLPTMKLNGDVTMQLKIGADTFAASPIRVTVMLRDDGGRANGGVDETVVRFDLNIHPRFPTPSFDLGASIAIPQNSTVHTFESWISNIRRTPYPIGGMVLSIATADPSLFAEQPRVLWAGGLAAAVTLRPQPGRYGATTVTVTLHDPVSGLSSSLARIVTIYQVFSAPTVFVLPRVTVWEGSAATSVAAVTISSAGQHRVNVSCTDVSLFSSPPYCSSTGILWVAPAAANSGTTSCSVGVTVLRSAAEGGPQTTTQAFQIEVRPFNRRPSFTTSMSSVSVLQGSGLYVQTWAAAINPGAATESHQVLSFVVTCPTYAIFGVPPMVSVAGMLSFTPGNATSGTAVCVVSLCDDGPGAAPHRNCSSLTYLEFTVVHVNSPPSFSLLGDVYVAQRAGPQRITGWLSAVSAGPSSDALQTVAITVSSTDSGFTALPTVLLQGSTGDLVFETATSFFGMLLLRICAKDSGGTTNGGRDTFCSNATMIVQQVNMLPTGSIVGVVAVPQTASPATVYAFLKNASAGQHETTQTLVRTVVCHDAAAILIATPSVQQDGSLTVYPNPARTGSVSCALSLQDSAGGISQLNFTVTVLHVNRAPSFTAVTSHVSAAQGGTVALPIATAITAGPSFETAQAVRFTTAVSPANAASVFSALPTVATDGVLSFAIRDTPSTFSSVTLSIALHDDGGTSSGGVDVSSTLTVTVALSYKAVPPTLLLSLTSVVVLEGAGNREVSGWILQRPARTTTRIETSSLALFATAPFVSANGSLLFTPAAHRFGIATCRMYLTSSDTGASASSEFTINVINVNSAPSAAIIGSLRVRENTQRVVPRWATEMSPGPFETTQTLRFSFVRDANIIETVSADVTSGDLSITPVPNATGTTTLTVTLHDDGGTDIGGVDRVVMKVTVEVFPTTVVFESTGNIRVATVRGAVTVQRHWMRHAPEVVSVVPTVGNATVLSWIAVNVTTGDLSFVARAVGSTFVLLIGRAADGRSTTRTITVTVLFSENQPTGVPNVPASTAAPAALFQVGAATHDVATGSSVSIPYLSSMATSVSTIAASTNDTAAFAVAPTVSTDGVVRFTTAQHAAAASISVTASESGGRSQSATLLLIVHSWSTLRVTLAVDISRFDVVAFKSAVAEEVSASASQVVVKHVASGSTVVEFYVASAQWEQNYTASLLSKFNDPSSTLARNTGSQSAVIVAAGSTEHTTTTTPTQGSTPETEATSPWIYVGVAAGIIILVAVAAVCACLRFRHVESQKSQPRDGMYDAASPPHNPVAKGLPDAGPYSDDDDGDDDAFSCDEYDDDFSLSGFDDAEDVEEF
jgi:hypothetical protein